MSTVTRIAHGHRTCRRSIKPWIHPAELDRYVLAFARHRFDRKYISSDNQEFRLLFDGASIHVPFAPELSPQNRRKLNQQQAMVVDIYARNVMYYETLEDMEGEWGVFAPRHP